MISFSYLRRYGELTDAVRVDESGRRWALSDGDLMYVLGLDDEGRLHHRYLGPPSVDERGNAVVPADWVLPFDDWWEAAPTWEYPARGAYVFGETTLAASFGAADRDLDLRYAEHEIDSNRLRIQLRDRDHPFAVDLWYEVASGTAVVRRWADIRNEGTEPVVLHQAGAFGLFRPPGSYVLHHLTGAGLNELNLIRETLTPGRKVLESRRGLTGHTHQPWFAIEGDGDDHVIFGALEWSGNWRLAFETDIARALSIVGGMSDFDFEHVLEPGSTFSAPGVAIGVVVGDVDDASRAMHRYIRARVRPRRRSENVLPVIFEGWNTTWGRGVSAERLVREAPLVADVGVELFIVTAGWYTDVEGTFGFISREGDWRPWPPSFPNGLEEVAGAVRSVGMRFGLWWEPEAVSADSELFAEHPDWVYQFEPRGPQPTRQGQLVLNLGRDDVYAHVRDQIFDLVDRYRLDYFRTDLNQSLRQLGDPSGRSGPGRDLAWRHVARYYRLLDEVRAAYPDLIIEGCAGGGGRIDLGILRRTDTTWLSDNANQLVRLGIFMSGTSFLPPVVCENWMVASAEHPPDAPPFGRPEWPRPDDDFQFRVCMMGHLGVGADLFTVDDAWKARARHHVSLYKELRDTIQTGDLYRMTPPPPRDGSGDWAVAVIVSPDRDEAVAFCFRLASDEGSFRLHVPGLRDDSRYEVRFDDESEPRIHTAAELAGDGIDVVVPNRHSSALLIARRV